MKKIFLKTALLVILGLTCFSFVAFVQSSNKTSEEGFVIIKVIESFNNLNGIKGKIMISDASGVIKTIPLEAVNLTNPAKAEVYETNIKAVQKYLNEMKSQGYKLVATNSQADIVFMTTYIFEK